MNEVPNTNSLLKRISIFLEDGDWDKANEYCERVLDIDPENSQAYIFKVCVELNIHKEESLNECLLPVSENDNFIKAVRFASDDYKKELDTYIENMRKNGMLRVAKNKTNELSTYKEASDILIQLSDYKNANSLLQSMENNVNSIATEALSNNDIFKSFWALKQLKEVGNFGKAEDFVKQVNEEAVLMLEHVLSNVRELSEQGTLEAIDNAKQMLAPLLQVTYIPRKYMSKIQKSQEMLDNTESAIRCAIQKKEKKKSLIIGLSITGFIIFAIAIIVLIGIHNASKNSESIQEPSPTPPPPTSTPSPTPEPTPDPNFIHDVDIVDMWFDNNDYENKRIRFTAFVDDNMITVKTDEEELGFIRLRQPINFIEYINNDETDDESEQNTDETADSSDDDELNPTILSGHYFTIIGRVSKTPTEEDETFEDEDFVIIFLDEVIAEEATEEEVEQINIREDERIAERIAREEREEAERIAREEREAAAAEEAERLEAERLEEEARKEQERIDRRRDFIAECKSINYDLFYATPDDYIKSRIQVTATVIEIFERGDVHNEAGFHVTENRREQKEWYVTIFMMSDDSSTISVGDTIRFYGTFEGVERFPHRTDGHVYLPTMNAWYFNNR